MGFEPTCSKRKSEILDHYMNRAFFVRKKRTEFETYLSVRAGFEPAFSREVSLYYVTHTICRQGEKRTALLLSYRRVTTRAGIEPATSPFSWSALTEVSLYYVTCQCYN